MQKSNYVQHLGTVTSITAEKIIVSFTSLSACATCHAKGACGPMDSADKMVEVNKSDDTFMLGEKVNVLMKESLGVKALVIGYIVPFMLVISTLMVFLAITKNEGLSGIVSLLVLVPYYIGVFFMKNRLEKVFMFSIQKLA